ncbi:hypothetical protein BDP27DRAFT_1442092 [Rhodocollybia butyracea]|uniref:Uncharacterized protein n=1 Tax=Rhodocollybia butyracea TaxID=206335 RepID=A0A9P5Q9E0_9AGAR|nr:hypothetical protein BDP27DRAFT_1442092 [Rhodocollybia butyracea]
MAGALSGHILDAYNSSRSTQFSGPFGIALHPTFNDLSAASWPSSSNNVVTSGTMSFDLDMHGNSQPMNLVPDVDGDTSSMNLSKATAIKIASLQAKLNRQLGPEYISTRPGPGGGPKLVYVEGWKIINLANEVFGFNGWSSNLVSLTTDFIDYNEETKRYSVGVTAIMRVTLRDGVFHEDVGYGVLENSKTKGPALDKCKKEAVTDGLKRSLRNFGNLLGNCLYDKQYTNDIVKVKVNPPKFNKDSLHRRPEFANDTGKSAPSTSNNIPIAPVPAPAIKSEPALAKPISSIPPHVREQVRISLQETTSPTTPANPQKSAIPTTNSNIRHDTTSTPGAGPSNRGSAARHAAILHGLNTPITPAPSIQRPHPQGPTTHNVRQVAFADSPLANRGAAAAAVTAPVSPEEPDDDGGTADESFALGSEDDAFFASVDLGEADMGRPIDFTEGLAGRRNVDQSNISLSTPGLHQPAQDNTVVSTSSISATGYSPPLFQQTSKIEQKLPQQQSSHQPQRPSSNLSRTYDVLNRQPQSGVVPNNPSRELNDSTNVINSTPAPRRMGGFSFPPGVLNRQPQQPLQGIGVKRPAEAMRTPVGTAQASRDRRFAPGMGLMSPSMTREQPNLGQAQGMGLDRGDGGDTKRMRH